MREAATGQNAAIGGERRSPARINAIHDALHGANTPQPKGVEVVQPKRQDVMRVVLQNRLPPRQRFIQIPRCPGGHGRGMRCFARVGLGGKACGVGGRFARGGQQRGLIAKQGER